MIASLIRYAPILELGAGTGHWAALLRARGVDVLAYDTRCWSDAFADADASGGTAVGDEARGAATGPAAPGGVAIGTSLIEGVRDPCVAEGGPEAAAAHAGPPPLRSPAVVALAVLRLPPFRVFVLLHAKWAWCGGLHI